MANPLLTAGRAFLSSPAAQVAGRYATPAIQTGIVAAGAAFAYGNAAELYRSRGALAAEFQREVTFPSDLIQDGIRPFYMSFKFQAYEKRAINNSPFLRSQGTIRLPIPDNIKDNMSVSYGTSSLGPAVGAGLESLVGTPQASGGDIASTISNFTSRVANTISGAVQGAAANTLATTGAGQAAQAYFGMAVNPYQAVLFEKPEFKTHSFSWKFMPRSEEETAAARDIFRTFQYHMSPGVSAGIGLFFSYPSMVIVSLYPSSEFLYRFKPCIVKSVNIDYSAGSSPSFFKRSQAPTAMAMNIELQEIEYWTNKDFTASSFNESAAIGSATLLAARAGSMASEVRGPGEFGNTLNP